MHTQRSLVFIDRHIIKRLQCFTKTQCALNGIEATKKHLCQGHPSKMFPNIGILDVPYCTDLWKEDKKSLKGTEFLLERGET